MAGIVCLLAQTSCNHDVHATKGRPLPTPQGEMRTKCTYLIGSNKAMAEDDKEEAIKEEAIKDDWPRRGPLGCASQIYNLT